MALWRALLNRPLLLAMLIAFAVIVPRTMLVAHAHSEYYDDEYHLFRGLQMLRGQYLTALNDPPTGEALIAIPLRLLGIEPTEFKYGRVLENQKIKVETLTLLIATWKAVLFAAFTGVVFSWVRAVFGLRSAWLAQALIVFDPNLATHVAPAALDLNGAAGIVIGCFTAWRYFQRPTVLRLIVAGVCCALAMSLKHTAAIMPGVIALMGLCFWIGRRREQRLVRQLWHVPVAVVVAAFTLTILSGGIQTPFFAKAKHQVPRTDVKNYAKEAKSLKAHPYISDFLNDHPRVAKLLSRPMPGGFYVSSLVGAMQHGDRGHYGLLLGERKKTGWWYYFAVVSVYKIPIGTFIVFGFALASLGWRRPTFDEIGLVLPMLAWAAFVSNSGINIGYRHFLPAYLFMLMYGSRAMLVPKPVRIAPIVSAGIAALHALSWHPNYLSYINWPRDRVWLQINDSNLDWGQSLKQIRAWVDLNAKGRPVAVDYFGQPDSAASTAFRHYLGKRAVRIDPDKPAIPKTGLLIISPVSLMHIYSDATCYRPLQPLQPTAIIGLSVLVYDIDALHNAGISLDDPGSKRKKTPARPPKAHHPASTAPVSPPANGSSPPR